MSERSPNLKRVAVATALVLTAAILSKFVLFDANVKGLKYDLLIVPLLLAAYLIGRKHRNAGAALLLCGAVSNSLVFIPFNPVQRAGPIFAKHDTPILRALWAKQEAHPRKWLVANAGAGATLVGLGFRSIRHVTITPQVTFFREDIPNFPPEKLNFYFNRFTHIILNPALKEPVVIQFHEAITGPRSRPLNSALFRTYASLADGARISPFWRQEIRCFPKGGGETFLDGFRYRNDVFIVEKYHWPIERRYSKHLVEQQPRSDTEHVEIATL